MAVSRSIRLCALALWLPLLLCTAGKAAAEEGTGAGTRAAEDSTAGSPAAASGRAAAARTESQIQDVVNDFRERLGIAHDVMVTIVPVNPLLVSVERVRATGDLFVISFEDRFLDSLEEDELRAVVAHELGHVWIFTNHPFLQTEQLANQIAMRVVTRESLVQVYQKVWQRTGGKGELSHFLADEHRHGQTAGGPMRPREGQRRAVASPR